MKTDKELLQLAARAVGYYVKSHVVNPDDALIGLYVGRKHGRAKRIWKPLLDDGDALRLAVDLDLDIMPMGDYVTVLNNSGASFNEPHNNDKHAATRRAIVRAAAAIGEGME